MKKRKLLREDILPAMASNRKVQRLLNEFMDLLSEYESTETNVDQVDPALLKVWLDLEHVLHRDTSRAATTNWWWSSCTWTLEWQKHRTILNFVSILKYIYHYWCVEKGSHLSTRLWFGALHFYVPKMHIVSRNVFKYTPFPPSVVLWSTVPLVRLLYNKKLCWCIWYGSSCVWMRGEGLGVGWGNQNNWSLAPLILPYYPRSFEFF